MYATLSLRHGSQHYVATIQPAAVVDTGTFWEATIDVNAIGDDYLHCGVLQQEERDGALRTYTTVTCAVEAIEAALHALAAGAAPDHLSAWSWSPAALREAVA